MSNVEDAGAATWQGLDGAAATPANADRKLRRVVLAAGLGTVIEYYDFSVYAFLATIIAAVFFPSSEPTAALLLTLAVFGASFVFRPLGGILLGYLADRVGRRPALLTAVIGMATATVAMGVLPSYASVGIAAPLLLALLRCVQGLSAGGELGGAAAYVAEAAPDHRRGFYTSTTQVGTLVGTMLGSLSVTLLRIALTPDQVLQWGWRIPFLISLPLAVITLLLRRNIEESEEFTKIESSGALARIPALSALRSNPRSVCTVFGLSLVSFAAYYLVFTYMGTYFERQHIMPANVASWSTTLTIVLATIAIPFWGKLTDRVGRRPLLIGVCVSNLVLAYPAFAVMGHSLGLAMGAQILLGQIEAAYLAVILATYCELFPARVRSSGFSLGYNIAAIVAGGLSPYVATQLIATTGSATSPAWLLIGTAAFSLGTALTVRETAGLPMPGDHRTPFETSPNSTASRRTRAAANRSRES